MLETVLPEFVSRFIGIYMDGKFIKVVRKSCPDDIRQKMKDYYGNSLVFEEDIDPIKLRKAFKEQYFDEWD